MRLASRRAPLPVGWAVRRARELVDPVARRRAAAAAGVPVPPRRLRARTGAPGADAFLRGGAAAASELEAAYDRAGRGSLSAAGSILDLGCGSARVLPHVAALAPRAQCTGADIDAAAIAWAAAHHPGMRWERSSFHPPLPFDDAEFDLVYSISVFSHLDAGVQDAWLAEVARVLAPGGVALLSVHGAHAFEQFRTGAVASGWCAPDAFARAPLGAAELAFVPYRRSVWNEGELPGVDGDYGLAFHGPDYVRSHWSVWFEIAAIVERGLTAWQDVVVCRGLR